MVAAALNGFYNVYLKSRGQNLTLTVNNNPLPRNLDSQVGTLIREEGREEGGREGGRKGGREEGREGRREGGREKEEGKGKVTLLLLYFCFY